MRAYELLAHIYAGQSMTFVNGELEWIGRKELWNEYDKIIKYFETFVV